MKQKQDAILYFLQNIRFKDQYICRKKGNGWRKIFLLNTNQKKAGVAAAAAAAKSRQSCLTLCDSIDGSLPGSSVPRILQARTLEWVAISFSHV